MVLYSVLTAPFTAESNTALQWLLRRTCTNLLFNLRCTVDKVVLPEVVVGVLDELNEGDEQSPRMGSVHYQPLQQHPTQGTHSTVTKVTLRNTPMSWTNCTTTCTFLKLTISVSYWQHRWTPLLYYHTTLYFRVNFIFAYICSQAGTAKIKYAKISCLRIKNI